MNTYVDELRKRLETLQGILCDLEPHRCKIDWLSNLDRDFGAVVNFGCSGGDETLALVWFLDATEAVGVDKNRYAIDLASTKITIIRQQLDSIESYVDPILKESANLRVQVTDLLAECARLSMTAFVVADMTQRTTLPAEHFDLAFCEKVLYHIACDEVKPAMHSSLSAVQEMARVTRPGGLVIAIEPTTCSHDDDTPVQLDPLFLQAGLIRLDTEELPCVAGDMITYPFLKPA